MRWQQHRGADFKKLAKHFGTDVVVIEREKKMELAAAKKGKKKDKGEPEEKPKSKSRSAAAARNDDMVDHGERSREGMDKRSKLGMWELDDEDSEPSDKAPSPQDYGCDGCKRTVTVPGPDVATVDAMEMGEFLCTHCSGTWVPWPDEDQPEYVTKKLKAGEGSKAKGTATPHESVSANVAGSGKSKLANCAKKAAKKAAKKVAKKK